MKARLVVESQDPNVEQHTEFAATIQNAVQCYCVIHDEGKRATTQTLLDHFFMRIDRIVHFPSGSVVKNLPAKARDTGVVSSIPGSRRSPGKGSGYHL